MKDGSEDTTIQNERPSSVQTSSIPAYSNFNDALDKLKKSEFYEKSALLPNKSGPSKILRKGDIKSNAVLVSPKQRGNPVLKSITNVPWEYDEIIPDYVMGRTTCALFLSLRYHNLNPDYIHERLKALGQEYELRVLLVQVDTNDPHHPLKYLTRVCLLANLTLMLAWSAEEAGRIIETYKIYEHKPPDLIMERAETSIRQKLVSALTTVRSINRTDASTLLNNFGSLKRIISSSKDSLSLCPGVGPQKATRLYNVLHQPFVKTKPPEKRKSSSLKTSEKIMMNFLSVRSNAPEKETLSEENTSADDILPSKKLNITPEKERKFISSSTLEKSNTLKCKETTITNVIPDKRNTNCKIFSTTEKKDNPPKGKKTTFILRNKD